jgi:hypothetical protein
MTVSRTPLGFLKQSLGQRQRLSAPPAVTCPRPRFCHTTTRALLLPKGRTRRPKYELWFVFGDGNLALLAIRESTNGPRPKSLTPRIRGSHGYVAKLHKMQKADDPSSASLALIRFSA